MLPATQLTVGAGVGVAGAGVEVFMAAVASGGRRGDGGRRRWRGRGGR